MKRSISELMDLLALGVLDYDTEAVADLREHPDVYLRQIDFCMVFCDSQYELKLLDELKDYIVSVLSEV